MKLGLFCQIVSVIAFISSSSAIMTQPSHAQSQKFFCGMSDGIPATMVRTSRGNIPMIRWVDTFFSPPWTPQQRCREISNRFQHFYNNGTLNFLRSGKLRGQPVLCVASENGGPCLRNGVLVTLKPNSNPQDTLQLLLDYRGGSSGGFIELNGGGNRNNRVISSNNAAYFNVKRFLADAERS